MDPLFSLVYLGAKLISHVSSLNALQILFKQALVHLKVKLILAPVTDAGNFHVYI